MRGAVLDCANGYQKEGQEGEKESCRQEGAIGEGTKLKADTCQEIGKEGRRCEKVPGEKQVRQEGSKNRGEPEFVSNAPPVKF